MNSDNKASDHASVARKADRADDANDPPTERELSQKQATENAQAARATHQSAIPGVPDDSPVIQGWVAALAAPVESAADALRETERQRVESKSPNSDMDEVAGPRSTDAPNVTAERQRREQPPTRSEDAEWDPLAATEEHRTDRKPR